MAFTVESKSGPVLSQPASDTSKAQAAREKAIAMLTNSQPQGKGQQPPAEVREAQARDNTEGQVASPEAAERAASQTSEEPEAPAKKEEPISSQYAVLARKEKQLRVKAQQQELAFKAREEALRAREQELSKKDSEYATKYIPKDRLLQDPLGVYEENGVTYDKLTEALLARQNQDPATRSYLQKLEAKIAELQGKVETVDKSRTEERSNSYNEALRQIQMDATSLVKNNPEFETIQATGSVKDVVELIKRTYDEDGILLSVEEAAQAVESELVEEAMKITRINKIQQRLKSATAPAAKQEQAPKKTEGMKTLTNAVGSTRQLTARERAIAAMEGRLNKS